MSKGTQFTIADLEAKGYHLNDKGEYVPGGEKKESTGTETIKTEWWIPGNVPSKKNSRQNFVSKNGKMVSIPSKLHAQYVKDTETAYQMAGIEFKRAVAHYNLQYPLWVQFHFIRETKRSFDYCNAIQTCEDIMKKDGSWIPDDSADFLLPVPKPYLHNKVNPGVYIKLLGV